MPFNEGSPHIAIVMEFLPVSLEGLLLERSLAQPVRPVEAPRLPPTTSRPQPSICFSHAVTACSLPPVAQPRQFSPGRFGSIVSELVTAVTYLHSLSPPVLHRDIKPANVFFSVSV